MKSKTSTRQLLKAKFDAIENGRVKRNILNALPFWVGALLTGLAAVAYAKLFLWAEQGTAYIVGHTGWLLFLITPTCFLVSWILVDRFSPFSRGSGIPQVSAAIELTAPGHHYKVSRLLSFRVILIKVASSLIMVFGGGAIGREGPTIQIAASIFKKINDLLPAWYPKISRQNMLVTGAAAGLSAAFNTPLGGIVFAIEELTKKHFSYFKTAILTGVIIAGLTALNILGPYLYLGYPKIEVISLWAAGAVLPVAVVSGFAGSLTGKIILFIFEKKRRLKTSVHRYLYPVVCGLILASLGYIFGSLALGSGKEIMVTTLFTDQKHVDWYIPLLRLVSPIISFSSGSAGGIFAPSLSAGASIGSVISGWFHLSDTESNLIILCGMTGCLTGITRSPFTSSILVIEMTNSHHVIFYLMLTALAANLISALVSKHSFYDYLKDQYISEIHHTERV
ncbi:MAG: chloride channel protein [Daejeonella sp.]|nr:chloride channel protein [Daejeonella sp.]